MIVIESFLKFFEKKTLKIIEFPIDPQTEIKKLVAAGKGLLAGCNAEKGGENFVILVNLDDLFSFDQ